MWFSTLSGLYPRRAVRDPVPGWLRRLAMLAWFTWFASWGWMLLDLMGGVPILSIFGGRPLEIPMEQVEARLPRWVLQLSVHFVACLGVHVTQLVHGMNLPFHKLAMLVPMVREAETVPSRAELLALLLDREAASGGYRLDTVAAFAHHADLDAWPTRRKVLQTWVRLQLIELDAQLRAGADVIDAPAGLQRVQDRSMELQAVEEALRGR